MFIFNFARLNTEEKAELKIDTGYLENNIACYSKCPKYSEKIERSVNILVENYKNTPLRFYR